LGGAPQRPQARTKTLNRKTFPAERRWRRTIPRNASIHHLMKCYVPLLVMTLAQCG
jgi:hypothetical protein